jgi:hypothetical protein
VAGRLALNQQVVVRFHLRENKRMPRVHKPAGTPAFKTREECEAWIADRVARWTCVFEHGQFKKLNFKVLNTKNPDFKPSAEDEPLAKNAKPARDSGSNLWFAYIPVEIV